MYEFKNRTQKDAGLLNSIKKARTAWIEYATNFLGEREQKPRQFNVQRIVNNDGDVVGWKSEFCETEGEYIGCTLWASAGDAVAIFDNPEKQNIESDWPDEADEIVE